MNLAGTFQNFIENVFSSYSCGEDSEQSNGQKVTICILLTYCLNVNSYACMNLTS